MVKVKLTEEQKRKNAAILARLEAEHQMLVEETRSLQQQYRRKIRRKQSKGRLSTQKEAG